jgi:aerobic carbon-monoxide dehydrogenase small subunit
MFAVQADGSSVTTVEGLAPRGCLSKIQDAFCEAHALQCGYCTPGMLVACHALVEKTPQPNEDQIRDAIGGNICRCTGYQQIVDAVKLATSPGYEPKGNPVARAADPGNTSIRGEQRG